LSDYEPTEAEVEEIQKQARQRGDARRAKGNDLHLPDPMPCDKWAERFGTGEGVKWLWDGFLPEVALSILHGEEKKGKTTLLLHLLAAISRGDDTFLSHGLRGGKVLVVSQENADIWWERIRDHKLNPDLIHFQHGTDDDPRPFWDHVRLDAWQWFASELASKVQAGGYQLLVLDVISDWWPVDNENDSVQVSRAVAPFARVAERAKCCVLAVAHSSKYGKGTRGSNSFPGKADTIIEMTGDERYTTRHLKVRGRYGSQKTYNAKLTSSGYVLDAKDRAEIAEATSDTLAVLRKQVVPLMPKPSGWTNGEIRTNWPAGQKRPAASTLRGVLPEAVRRGILKTSGSGTKGDPIRYVPA
jgi:predicted ATP-dependent serine protease